MFVFILVMGLFTGGATVEQFHFSKCEKLHFRGPACSFEKSLCLKGKDKNRCNE